MDLPARMRLGPLLWDGGIGTGLVARGLDLGAEPPEAWLLRRPAEVRALHEEFALAGADVLQTNSFGLLRLLCRPDPEPWLDMQVLVATAVALAREAATAEGVPGPPPIIVASLGPSGQPDPDPGRVTDLCAELGERFAAAGAAALHLETCYHPGELSAALRGVRAGAPALPVLVSITVDRGDSGLQTPVGTPLASMLRIMEKQTPEVVGVNCSQSARRMLPSVEALSAWAGGRVPILAQPQVDGAGPDCKRRTPPETEEQFVHGLRQLLLAGADAVGGCCGCRGPHLLAARRALGPRGSWEQAG